MATYKPIESVAESHILCSGMDECNMESWTARLFLDERRVKRNRLSKLQCQLTDYGTLVSGDLG